MTHCRELTLVWNSLMIVGTATLRIVLSSTMMNSELDRTTSAIHRFGSGAAGAALSDTSTPRLDDRLQLGRRSAVEDHPVGAEVELALDHLDAARRRAD